MSTANLSVSEKRRRTKEVRESTDSDSTSGPSAPKSQPSSSTGGSQTKITHFFTHDKRPRHEISKTGISASSDVNSTSNLSMDVGGDEEDSENKLSRKDTKNRGTKTADKKNRWKDIDQSDSDKDKEEEESKKSKGIAIKQDSNSRRDSFGDIDIDEDSHEGISDGSTDIEDSQETQSYEMGSLFSKVREK